MIVLKILGLAALMLVGIGIVAGILWLFSKAIGGAYVYTPPKQYEYKHEELWEAPAHWKKWEKNV